MSSVPQKCSGCGSSGLKKIEGTYAFTKVSRERDQIVFFPSSGIPVILYVCPQCGQISVYSAQAMKAI